MASYTPGPWVIADDGTIESRDGGLVGYLSHCSDPDARLIALSPQMLNVLKVIRFTSYIKKFLLDMDPQAYRLIDWVINNAEGAEAK